VGIRDRLHDLVAAAAQVRGCRTPAIQRARIPATSNPEHLQDNMRAAFGPMPDASLREQIARAATGR
jgi:hypothetical protein